MRPHPRATPRRVGLIVPSSNTTMETEIPELVRRARLDDVTFHGSRSRLHTVDEESLRRMVGDSERCAAEIGDLSPDVVAYACLVAVMAQGAQAHEDVEARIANRLASAGSTARVVSSAGALVRTLQALELRRIALVAPYHPSLTALVTRYLGGSGVEVVDSLSLSVTDNMAVGCLDPWDLPGHVERLDTKDVDGIVLSACVQMPSLPAVPEVERATGLPVITAATATAREVLLALGEPPHVPDAGSALAPIPETAA